ncbi:MAG: SH3 domain-containing protein, partial [Methyloceanibacter sp.]
MIFAKSHLRCAAAAAAAAWAIGPLLAPVPAAAQQPNGYPVTNVNLRAGPGTEYPVIVTVPGRAPISILGCLPDYSWCDSLFQGNRGWMRSIYLSGYYQGSYYSLGDYA